MDMEQPRKKPRVSAFTIGVLTVFIGAAVFLVLALLDPSSCADVDNYDGPCIDEDTAWLVSFVVTIPIGIIAGGTVALWRKLRERSTRRG